MIALLLAVALNCGNTATQLDLDDCAQAAQIRADRDEQAAYRTAPAAAQATETLWRTERTATCEYYYQSASGGSMAPMLYSQCLANSARGRIRDLHGVARGFSVAQPHHAIVEHDRIYGLLEVQLTSHERALLAASESAWLRYRKALCSNDVPCLGQVSATRTQELKDSWLADPFW